MRFLLSILLLISVELSFAKHNPMFGNGDEVNDTTELENTITKPETKHQTVSSKTIKPHYIKKMYNDFIRKNNRIQAQLRSKIVKIAYKIKNSSSSKSYLWILLISLLYGMAHSLGPGHNKVLIFSYFIGEDANIKQGLILGNLMSFIHAASGLITVSIITYVVKESVANYDNSTALFYIQKISFGLITIIGFILLFGHIKEYHSRKNKIPKIKTSKSIIPMALGLGLIPCPGTMILVSFLTIAGLQYLAPLAALFMAIGMAITISSIGVMTIISKKFLLRLMNHYSELISKIQFVMAVVGSILIIGFGLLFII